MGSSAVTGARRGRRGTLSRDQILTAALRIAESHGPDALTMRRVATDLGVDPMALYRHVDNKDALLGGVAENSGPRSPRRHAITVTGGSRCAPSPSGCTPSSPATRAPRPCC